MNKSTELFEIEKLTVLFPSCDKYFISESAAVEIEFINNFDSDLLVEEKSLKMTGFSLPKTILLE